MNNRKEDKMSQGHRESGHTVCTRPSQEAKNLTQKSWELGVSGHVDLIFCTVKNKATESNRDWRVKFKRSSKSMNLFWGEGRHSLLTRKSMKGTRWFVNMNPLAHFCPFLCNY